jgi:hypothetical protein
VRGKPDMDESSIQLSGAFLYNDTMNRWPLSILGGFLIPVCYTLAASRVTVVVNNETCAELFWWPVSWPSYIYYSFFPPHLSNEEVVMLRGLETGNFLSLIIGNAVVYMLLTYAFLYWLSNSKSSHK